MGLGTEWTPTLLSRLAETALRRVELTARVSLLRAPCGYGKSATLAAGWKEAADTGRPALWASLASDDTKKGTLRRLAFQAGTAADIESILQWIWHQDRPGIICLDDVQEAPHLETLTRDMMDALPDDWRAVLATSAPWGFGVLNADWQEVGPDALACRAQDLKELIRVPSALDRIISDTQGWPALCRIAGRVSHRMQPLHLWPEIICYLDQMVLAPLSPALRTWLKKAALIAPLDAESHDFALRVHDGAQWIARAQRECLLLRPDSDGMFALNPALRHHLALSGQSQLRSSPSHLLKRAAFHHWRAGRPAQTIALSLRAGDPAWARGLGGEIVMDVALRQGRIDELAHWLEGVPDTALLTNPMAGLGKIWALSFQQQHAGATHLLKLLSRTDAHEELLTLLGATTAALRDDVVRAEMLCRQWLELHARENPMMKASALACLASIVASQSNAAEFAALRPLLDQAFALADQGFARDWAKIAEVLLLLTQGQIIPARNRIDAHLTDMVSPVAEQTLKTLRLAVLAESGVPLAELEWPLLFCDQIVDVRIHTARAILRAARLAGDADLCEKILTELDVGAVRDHMPRLQLMADILTAEHEIASGRSVTIPNIPRNDAITSAHLAIADVECMLLSATRALADRKDHLARQLTDRILARIRRAGWQHIILKTLMLRSVLHLRKEALQLSIRSAEEASEIRDSTGLKETAREFRNILEHIHAGWAVKARFDRSAAQHHLPSSQHTEGSDLSRRQLHILGLARDGLTSAEIANILGIGEDGVKWHFRAIFKCLAVNRRTQAVATAIQRGLLH